MEAKAKVKSAPCIPGVLPGGLNRTKFFDGMFLTQKDLEREQNYWFMKRRLTNRALGTGVVWGLRLQWDSMKRRFHLSPGYALDCCGQDLVVECDHEFSERSLVDLSDPLVRALMSGRQLSSDRCPKPADIEGPRKAGVILQYMECPEEPKPVHQDACSTSLTRCEYSSIRETTRLLLVPPPQPPKPVPVENFCANIESLRQDCEAVGVDCNLFQTQTDPSSSLLKARIRVQEQAARVPTANLRPDLDPDNPTVDVTLNLDNNPTVLRVWLEPDPGYVFLGGKVTDITQVDTPLMPFDVDLPAIDIAVGGDMVTFAITDLEVAPLFSKALHQKVNMAVSLTPGAGQDVNIRVLTENVEAVEESASCADLTCPGLIFNTDPSCVIKTLAFNATSGWFKSLMGPLGVNALGETSVDGRHQLAWLICLLSWRLLFRANLEEDTEAKLSGLVQKLFTEWCSGFVYPGPHCTEEHHGVYLGCVELSRKGSIINFDPWEFRRHVITGPLMNHWRGQLGFAPIDVVGSRMAQWICCLSKSEGIGILSNQIMSLSETYIPITEQGVGLYYGADFDTYLTSHGLVKVGDTHSLKLTELGQMVIASFLHSDPARDPSRLSGRSVYAVAGQQDVFLLIPVFQGFVGRPGGLDSAREVPNELKNKVGRITENIRPLARNVVSDFLVEFSYDIELNSLRVPTGNDYFQPLVTALKSSGVVSVGDFLSMGPEAAVKRAIPYAVESGIEEVEIAYAAVEDVYEAAEELLEKTAKPLLTAAKDTATPFIRERLEEDSLISSIRKGAAATLKRNHLTKTEVSSVAERVIGMG